MFVLAMPIGMTAPRMAVTVVATITMATTIGTTIIIIVIALVAHVAVSYTHLTLPTKA